MCLVILFFCTFFGMKLLHLPNFRFPTKEEYDALEVLGKLNKRIASVSSDAPAVIHDNG